MFEVGTLYYKNDIYRVLNVPQQQQKGAWDTGYREYEGSIYIFSNIGIAGRTGHDYANFWDGILFNWEAKNNSKLSNPLIQKMIDPLYSGSIFLFTRTDNREAFVYEGKIKAYWHSDSSPVKIIWQLLTEDHDSQVEVVETFQDIILLEGAAKRVNINKYERNPLARRICIKHYGAICQICNFDFEHVYGDIGSGFIHVHHLKLISASPEQYELDPIKDLIPVCPNCHSIIHRTKIPISVEEVKRCIISSNVKNA